MADYYQRPVSSNTRLMGDFCKRKDRMTASQFRKRSSAILAKAASLANDLNSLRDDLNDYCNSRSPRWQESEAGAGWMTNVDSLTDWAEFVGDITSDYLDEVE